MCAVPAGAALAGAAGAALGVSGVPFGFSIP
jgi:hypothetical protein